MAVTLRAKRAAPDRPAQVEHRPRRKAQRPGAFRGPDRRLQRQRIVVAGERRNR